MRLHQKNYSLILSSFDTACHKVTLTCDGMFGSCVTSSSMLIAFAARTDMEYCPFVRSATMQEALRSLNEVSSNIATPKTIKKNITDMVADLTNGQYSISVRAANAISMLDDVTQDPNMPSHVRVTLWQAVSKLESIRE